MKTDFWRGKRVFMTGHTGFKGSWMSLWLQSLGAEVTGYALKPPTNPSLFSEARVVDGMDSVPGDIRDLEHLRQVMQEAQPEVVFHMAAQPLVRHSYQNPAETYATNVMGTVHLFEAVRATPTVRAVVNITSDKCYENREWVWGYRELDPMGGFDPYSSSKGCAELVSAAYRSSFFNSADFAKHRVALATVRAGNTIGGGDWAKDRLIPDIIRAICDERPILIRNPRAIRPWQHVFDVLRGYLLLAQRLCEEGPVYAEGWNFGPEDDDAWPVSAVVERTMALWGEGPGWRLDGEEHQHEATYLKLDCSKARSLLGWRPRWRLVRSLEQTVAWYRAHVAGADMRNFSLEQISAYCCCAQGDQRVEPRVSETSDSPDGGGLRRAVSRAQL